MKEEAVGLSRTLRAAANAALAELGRDGDLRPVWFTGRRAIFLQAEPAPPLFIKVYQQASQLEREVAVMRRASEADIPVAPLVSFVAGPPAVLITEQVAGVPLSSVFPGAAKGAGRILRRFHALGAAPPFAGGGRRWSAFIRSWAEREIVESLARGALPPGEASALQRHYSQLAPVLDQRPCALILGDCQTDHVLVDPTTQEVRAILDFVDTQPGDPLVDVAVLTLWDAALTAPVLRGYGEDIEEAAALLPAYRLLRHLGAANWLVRHGLPDEALRHDRAVREYVSELRAGRREP